MGPERRGGGRAKEEDKKEREPRQHIAGGKEAQELEKFRMGDRLGNAEKSHW